MIAPRPSLRAIVTLLLTCACCASAGELTWRRRALRAAAPDGYLAIVVLKHQDPGTASAALGCEVEGVEARVTGDTWQVLAGGKQVAAGTLPGASRRFFVKRTPERLLVGIGDRWVYGCEAAASAATPAVRLGVGAGSEIETFRVVAREQVSFADDFPDPEPKPGLWVPRRGRWVLSSLTYAAKSANPAELAAVFDEIEDVASANRTRSVEVGIGVMLDRRSVRVIRVAEGSPADEAGIQENDIIRSIDGVAVSRPDEAAAKLQGEEGKPVKLAVYHNGSTREVELRRALIVWGRARRQEPIPPSEPADTALITAGHDFWTDYRFTCGAQIRGVGALGIVFAWLGPGDYHVVRWLSADKVLGSAGRLELARVRGGKATVLASQSGGFFPNEFYELSVAVEGDALGQVRATASVDGRDVISAADDAIVPGRLGFWAAAPGSVSFDDVGVGKVAERRTVRRGPNAYQRTDPVMRAWADPVYSWEHTGLGHQWLHRSDFPGDVTISAPVKPGEGMALFICADRRENASGYGLHYDPAGAVRLSRAGQVVAEKPIANNAEVKRLALRREGARVRVLADGQQWLEHTDREPLRGAAVRIKGALPRDVTVECPNVVEYFFSGMPTEWHVIDGNWEVMNRWVCNPTWSFFGGRGDGLLAIGSKRKLSGNAYLDVDLGVMMFAYGGYQNMRDVGLTICSPGNDVAQGYTAIVGANGNTLTALFRNGQLVAQTSHERALLPKQWMRGRSTELYSQHRGWVHIKLCREGRVVRLYVWEVPVLEYEDPEPLPDGHAAIWSTDNGILIAKARLAADQVGKPQPFLRRHPIFADGCLTNDCADGHTRVTADGSLYTVTNTVGGGPFALALRPRVFSALERPRLTFDVKLSPEAKVDLYFRCHGTLCRVALSGPDETLGFCTTIGRFEGVEADGEWHSVSFDLLGALRTLHPMDNLLMVWQPMFANHANKGYLLAGFGGNPAGATYWLRNVRLEATGTAPQLSQKPRGE